MILNLESDTFRVLPSLADEEAISDDPCLRDAGVGEVRSVKMMLSTKYGRQFT